MLLRWKQLLTLTLSRQKNSFKFRNNTNKHNRSQVITVYINIYIKRISNNNLQRQTERESFKNYHGSIIAFYDRALILQIRVYRHRFLRNHDLWILLPIYKQENTYFLNKSTHATNKFKGFTNFIIYHTAMYYNRSHYCASQDNIIIYFEVLF